MGVIADSFSARLKELVKLNEESDRMLQKHLQDVREVIEKLDELSLDED